MMLLIWFFGKRNEQINGLISEVWKFFNITNYHIRYVKNPLLITVNRTTVANQRNCELDDSTHRVIVDIATDLMMNRVKEQKMQKCNFLVNCSSKL